MRNLITRKNPADLIYSVWKGNVRNFSSVIRERLGDEDKKALTNLIENESVDPYGDYDVVKQKAEKILQEVLPNSLQDSLRNFGQNGRSIFLLQNCPIIGADKTLPPIPAASKRSEIKDNVSEYFMFGISDLIGTVPYLIEGVRDGSVINQIIPTNPYSNSGSGSKISFDLHNEVVHEKRVPDYFLLLALKGNPLAKTTFGFLDDIIPFLPPQILEELQKPNFVMKSGDKAIFKEAKEFRCPIITTDEKGNYNIRLNTAPGRCEAVTDEAKIALKYLTECLKKDVPVQGISLSDGEMMIVPNKESVHGRSEFEGERWVQRMNLLKESALKNSSQER